MMPAEKAQSWPGRSSLARPSYGPAVTWRTRTPGTRSASTGVSPVVRRVKMSTSTPRAASSLAVSAT